MTGNAYQLTTLCIVASGSSPASPILVGDPGVRGGDPGDLGDINDTADDPNDTADDRRSGGDAKSCDTGDNANGGDKAAVRMGDVRVSALPRGAGVVRIGVAPVGVGPIATGTGAGVVKLKPLCA